MVEAGGRLGRVSRTCALTVARDDGLQPACVQGALHGVRQAVEKKNRVKNGAYTVAKAGVVILTEVIAAETSKYGITANCILPGTIDSPDNRAHNPGADYSSWTSAEAIADVILFLISDAGSITSGAAIPVYGNS